MTLIADCHIDTLSKLLDLDEDENPSLYASHPDHQVDLPRLKQAGLRFQVFSIFTLPSEAGHYGAVRSLRMMEIFRRDVRNNPDTFALVETRQQLEAVESGPKILYGLFSMEGASPLCGDMKMLEIFFRAGLRAIGLTWNHRNELADGVGVGSPYGLTPFGRQVIQRMNELGMVVDISHLNEAGFWEVMELSDSPVIASHSNAKALCSHRRNLTDDQLKAIRDKQGFVGMCFSPSFLNAQPEQAELEDVVRHIDHICELIGPEHIGLGSDFDGLRKLPKGLEDVSCFPALFERLEKRGYSSSDLDKIMYQNVLRVYREVLPGV